MTGGGGSLIATGSTTINGYDFSYKAMPWWQGGTSVALDDGRETAPEIRAFDRDGKLVFQSVFTMPNGRLIYVWHVARSYDGTVAVEGSAFSDDSRGGTFIAWLSPDGRQQKIVRTTPFASLDMTFAADGTLWAAGRELEDGEELNADHNMIRRFDRSGKLLGSWIPKSSLTVDRKVGLRHPAVRSLLVSSRNRVGWYSVGAREYFEFSLDGTIVRRFPTFDLREGMRVNGAALCDDGGLYISTSFHENRQPRGEVFGRNRSDGTWKRISVKGADVSTGMKIFACEGSEVVAATGTPSNLIWFKPDRAE